MKALTLHQPFASLVAHGAKRVETRGWSTHYRGPLAIHAGLRLDREARVHVLGILRRHGHESEADLPRGAVVAIAELVDVVEMIPCVIANQTELERELGDWRVGRFAWVLRGVRAIEPVPARGAQGLWTLDEALLV